MSPRKAPLSTTFAALIILSAACCLLWPDGITALFALSPHTVATHPYALFSYAFIHAGLLHTLVNAAAIYLCGSMTEPLFGARRTALLYLASTIAAGLTFCMAMRIAARPDAILSGASAPAFAAMMCLCVSRRMVLTALALAALSFAGLFGPNPGGAIAHITGVAAGFIAAILYHKHTLSRINAREAALTQIRNKIRISGFDSLSPAERATLSSDRK